MDKGQSSPSMRRGFTSGATLVVVGVIIVIALVIWWFNREPAWEQGITGIDAAQDAENLPLDPTQARAMSTGAVNFFVEIKANAYLFPEFTDDQRLNNGNDQYGPIAHIVPTDSVQDWTIANFQSAGQMGKLVGGIAIDDTIDVSATPLPATYTNLGLNHGGNCFYLANQTGLPADWKAYITPKALVGDACPANHDVSAAALRPVIALTDASHTAHADVPAVARFHEGEKGSAAKVTYMGIKCASSWCFVLPTGMLKTDTIEPFHKKPTGQTKHWFVRGWFDTQRLGFATGTDVVQFDTDLEATVVPEPNLGDHTDASFTDFVRVARVEFAKNPNKPPYNNKWHFEKENNEIFIREDPTSKTGWVGKIFSGKFTPQGDSIQYALVVRRDKHTGQFLPGTARWAWRDRDEWIWVRCGEGCCWVSPE